MELIHKRMFLFIGVLTIASTAYAPRVFARDFDTPFAIFVAPVDTADALVGQALWNTVGVGYDPSGSGTNGVYIEDATTFSTAHDANGCLIGAQYERLLKPVDNVTGGYNSGTQPAPFTVSGYFVSGHQYAFYNHTDFGVAPCAGWRTENLQYITYTGSGFLLASSINPNTRIDYVQPPNDTTVSTSTAFSFEAIGYLSAADAHSTTRVRYSIHPLTAKCTSGLLPQFLCPTDVIGALQNFSEILDINPAVSSTAQSFVVSTTTYFHLDEGKYVLTTELLQDNSFYGLFSLPAIAQVSTTTIFTAGTTTTLDNIYARIHEINASTTASLESLQASCNPLSFNLGDCFAVLFVPDLSQLSLTWNALRAGFLSAVPWGYITLIVADINNTATSTLPMLNVSTPAGFPITASMSYDVFGHFPTASTSLFSTATSSDGKTFRQVFEPDWNLIVALIFALAVMRLLLKTHGTENKSEHV